jgi:FtsH-binding integral membrane protein
MENNQIQNQYGSWEEVIEQYDGSANAGFIARYMTKVYAWMFVALMITAGVAWVTASNEAMIQFIASNRMLFFGLMIGQLFLVGFLSLRIMKMSSTLAGVIFLAYAALNGFTFAILLGIFTLSSIFTVFAITAGTFGVMSAVGYFTKTDLTSFGRLMFMALIGIIIASIVNIFMHSSTLYWIISYVGVAVFVGLIAYDTQKIKAYALMDSAEDRKRGAIIGALALYLDFINLFIYLLRILGDRK